MAIVESLNELYIKYGKVKKATIYSRESDDTSEEDQHRISRPGLSRECQRYWRSHTVGKETYKLMMSRKRNANMHDEYVEDDLSHM